MSRLTREEVEERLQHLRANEEVGLLIPVEDLCVDLLVAWADRDTWRAEALAARKVFAEIAGRDVETLESWKEGYRWARDLCCAALLAANGEE